MKKNTKTFLAFSAHPDDVDFTCSASIFELTSKGNSVMYAVITGGQKGTHKVKQTEKEMVAMRKREQRAAAGILGVKEVVFLDETDGTLENTSALREKIARVIRKVKPDIVISGDPANQSFDSFGRFHRDHRVAAEAVFDAIYPGVGSDAFFPELLKEGLLPHQLEEVWFFNPVKPNLFFDISKTFKKKMEALGAHESQIPDMKDVEKRLRDRAKEMGKEGNLALAEAFRRLAFT